MTKQVIKVLIVEDGSENRKTFRRILEQDDKFAYKFLEEEPGEKVLETCFNEQPDCVLLGSYSAEKDCLAFIAALNKDSHNPSFPIILLTDIDDEVFADKAFKLGVLNYFVKGKFSVSALRHAVHSAIEIVNLRRLKKQLENVSQKDPEGNTVQRSEILTDIAESEKTKIHTTLLAEIGELTRKVEDPDDLLFAVSKAVGEHLEARRCLFNEIDLENDVEIVHRDYCRGVESVTGKHKVSIYSPVTSGEMQRGKTVVNFDSKTDSRTRDFYETAYEANGERAYIAVPLLREKRWVASLWMSDDKPRKWSKEEVTLLETIAERVWSVVEKLRIDSALRESEERFRRASDAAIALVYDIDLTGGRNVIVHGLERVTGYQPYDVELTSEWWHSLIHTEDLPAHQKVLNRHIETGGRYFSVYRILRKDGTLIWVEDTAQIVKDNTGKAVQIVGAIVDISERKQTEEALAKTADSLVRERERLAVALRTGRLGVYEWHLGESSVWWSPEVYPVYGVEPDSFTPTPENFNALVYPDDREELWRKTEDCIARREVFTHEYRIIRPDGKVRWIANRSHVGLDDVGQVERITGVAVDITERKQAEEKLRASHNTFRQLVENSPFGIYVIDADFRLAQVGAGAQKVFENVRPLIGRDFAEVLRFIWSEPFASEAIERFRHTLETGETYHAPSTVEHRRDITEIESYDWKIERIIMPDGRFGVVCHFYDLSERQRFEAELQESEEKFRTLADNMSQFAWMANDNGWAFWYNKRWFEYTGTTYEEMQGLGWKSVHHPDHIERVMENLQLAWDSGEIWEDTFPLRSKTGEYRWFLSRAVPIRDAEGKIIHWFGTNTDIHDKILAEAEREKLLAQEKILRKQAEDANRAKDEFLAMLSHELRSPLNAMYGWSQILQNHELDADKTRQAVEVIARNVRLQKTLIEDLLDVSRIISGKMQLESEMVSLVSIVQAAVEAARPIAESHSLVIELSVDARSDEMIGDKHRLQQVVSNLLTNAIKFTPDGGLISIALNQVGERIRLTVTDCGIGISQDLLPHIFDRFRQADGSTKRKYGGLGLGLTIVRHLVELHCGTVTAHSEGEGKGATFKIEFPLAPQFVSQADLQPTNNANQTLSQNTKPLEGNLILVVDDNRDVLDLIYFALERDGATVICCSSAQEALEQLQTNQFDLLISDLGMAEMDGFDLIQKVRAEENGNIKKLPAIALTGFVSTQDRERVIQAGFQTHLAKPVDLDNLRAIAVSLIKT